MRSLCRDCLATGEAKVSRCPACGSPRVVFHEELGRLSMARAALAMASGPIFSEVW